MNVSSLSPHKFLFISQLMITISYIDFFSILYSCELHVTFNEIGGLRIGKGFGSWFLPVEPMVFIGPV